MPIIRATCQTCGDVELAPRDLKVLVCSNTGGTTYTFLCPGCGLVVSKATDRQVVEVLVSAGVKLSFWRLPAELEERVDGPPLVVDDLISFHFEIAEPNWIDRLASSVRNQPDTDR
ncbi:MAG: hypothetical protein ACP5O0_04055 [Acidimicrobiales bacterium]